MHNPGEINNTAYYSFIAMVKLCSPTDGGR